MKKLLFIQPLSLLILCIAIGFFFETGCKSNRILKEKQRQEKLKIENATTKLNFLITSNLPIDEHEKQLFEIKSQNINNPDVTTLIKKAEEKLKAMKEVEEKKKQDEIKKQDEEKIKQEEKNKKEQIDLSTQLNTFFDEIALAGKSGNLNTANTKIDDALKLFCSDDALVLIIISKTDKNTDYDKPTNAKVFLNYIKDKKENKYKVDKIVTDDKGKVKELELIKK